MKLNNETVKLLNLIQKDSELNDTLILPGSGNNAILLRPSYTGFISYQISDPSSTLSGALTINLEMSNDGQNWLPATDATDTTITHSLSAGSSVMEKLSDVNPAIKLRLVFVTAVTGTLNISTRI